MDTSTHASWWRKQLDLLRLDLRDARRRLIANSSTSLVVIASLAACIGANTAVFSVVDALVLRTLPVAQPEQLVFVETKTATDHASSLSYGLYRLLRESDTGLTDVAAQTGSLVTLVSGEQAELARAEFVSGNYFTSLQVPVPQGRAFTGTDDREGGEAVAVISHAFWQQKLGGDPAVVGKAVLIEHTPFVIIGVAEPRFTGLSVGSAVDVWMPLSTYAMTLTEADRLDKPGTRALEVWARLPSPERASATTARLDALLRHAADDAGSPLQGEDRKALSGAAVDLVPGAHGRSGLRRELGSILLVSLALVGLVLLVACANIANVRLSGAMARQAEIAVRMSIGGTRGRIVRQWLTESVLLALLGGAAGLLVARPFSQLLLAFVPASGPFLATLDVRMDMRVLAFTAGISLLTGLVFGTVPAIRASRVETSEILRGGSASSRVSARFATALIWTQVALATTVVTLGALFAGSLYNLKAQSLGFEADQVLLFQVDPRMQGYSRDRLAPFYTDVLEQLRAIPGVTQASFARRGVLSSDFTRQDITVSGYAPRTDDDRIVSVDIVAPRFFSTMGVTMVAGRDFTGTDSEKAAKVVIVNETFARQYFGTTQAVGRQFTYGKPGESDAPLEVVGVVRDAAYRSLRSKEPMRMVYVPYLQAQGLGMMIGVLKTTGPVAELVPSVRTAVARVDRRVPVLLASSMASRVDRTLVAERLAATFGGVFASIALVLACLGIYGVTAYAMLRRTNEIGVRLALGGRASDIVRMGVLQAQRVIITAAIVGLAAAAWLGQLAAGVLFEITPTEPWMLMSAFAAVVITGSLAALVPVWRASRLSPLHALRVQ